MKLYKYILALAFLLLTGCGMLQIGVERGQRATATSLPATQTAVSAPVLASQVQASPILPTLVPSEPAPTPTLALTPEIIIQPTDAPAEPTATPGPQMVKIYLIAIDDNGQSGALIGCGDSAIAVDVEVEPTKEVLRASLEKLLSIQDQFYGQSGLYNALYQSDLQLENIALDNGKAVINLTGTLMLGGVCDNPRVQAQLESTVLQFYTVQEVTIYINGQLLKDALSLK